MQKLSLGSIASWKIGSDTTTMHLRFSAEDSPRCITGNENAEQQCSTTNRDVQTMDSASGG